METRDAELRPREANVAKKEKEIVALDASLRQLQDELNTARVSIEKRDREQTEKESELVKLSERSVEYEAAIKDYAAKYLAVEERMLSEEKAISKLMEETSARREEVLAKIKTLHEQETLLAESKRLVMDEQRRFVEWERTLNDREAELGKRERSLERAASLPRMEAAPEPEPASEVPRHEEERHEPKIEVKEPEPIAVESEEAGLAEAFCPECRTIVSASADTCYACGADLKNPRPPERPKEKEKVEEERPKAEVKELEAKAEEKRSEEEHKDAEAKKSVSIRKIIKRK